MIDWIVPKHIVRKLVTKGNSSSFNATGAGTVEDLQNLDALVPDLEAPFDSAQAHQDTQVKKEPISEIDKLNKRVAEFKNNSRNLLCKFQTMETDNNLILKKCEVCYVVMILFTEKL